MTTEMAKTDNLPLYLFHQGTNFKAYEFMGVHKKDGDFTFRTWAPNADKIIIAGQFNAWGEENEETFSMSRESDAGVWSLILPEKYFLGNFLYKFKIFSKKGVHFKSDPYAFYSQRPPETASVFFNIDDYEWHDSNWLEYRRLTFDEKLGYKTPINIYEIHLGSFMKNGEEYLNYRELAPIVTKHVKKLGYTHVEILPICEHPYDGSWGYQITGFYSATSRFGDPCDLKYFIDYLHQNGVGVILDWVPAHFPKDEHGLINFDGSPLYEYQGLDRMEHKIWGTRFFDVGRCEVQSFLISNALFWIREFHADGLRADAVASMLYLDYDRQGGEWLPNIYGENKNLEAIAFFRKLNTAVKDEFCDVLMIAEESTEWAKVTEKAKNGGLGFDFKWNMGWMNDTLSYISINPFFRKHHHRKLTFSFFYAFSEKFILPISHDEVVHGKKSLLDKFPGDYEQKFAGLRALLVYIMSHPGKKLMFMGCEYGQFSEWQYDKSLEWFMRDFDMHKKLEEFFAVINNFYLTCRPLWENDFNWQGFNWIVADDIEQNIIVFERMALDGERIITVINFSDTPRENYRFGVKDSGSYRVLLNSDDIAFGGKGSFENKVYTSESLPSHCYQNSIEISIPAMSGLYLGKAENCER